MRALRSFWYQLGSRRQCSWRIAWRRHRPAVSDDNYGRDDLQLVISRMAILSATVEALIPGRLQPPYCSRPSRKCYAGDCPGRLYCDNEGSLVVASATICFRHGTIKRR